MQKHYLDLFQLVLLGLDSIHFLAQGLTEKQQQKTQWIPWTTQAASMLAQELECSCQTKPQGYSVETDAAELGNKFKKF